MKNINENNKNDIIKDYLNGLSCNEICKKYHTANTTLKKFLKENNIELKKKYTLNENIFNTIDSEEKAYWMGFIWCDGYNGIRHRNKNKTYEFKLSIMSEDYQHLEKFNTFLQSNREIKYYVSGSFNKKSKEARLLIANSKFGYILEDKYGLIPNRTDTSKLLNNIPKEFIRDFIRGVVDADGSLICSFTKGEKYSYYKASLTISTYEELDNFINDYLYENNIINCKSKLSKRHKERDGNCFTLKYCGNINAIRLMDWLYKDSKIYLDRKYKKYLKIKEIIKKQNAK